MNKDNFDPLKGPIYSSKKIRLKTWEYDPATDTSLQPYSEKLEALAEADERIDEYEHGGESHWLHLADGWTDGECHTIHETTVQECLDILAGVERCNCVHCSQE
ncbi:MAG: hypothetical protein MK165_14035 [Pirellulaceae bacterium]|nr:hypothetical protein [Pirellulaceae bacterium]